MSGWPQIRAGLIAVVLLIQFLDAVPLPELKESNLKQPLAQDELDRWTEVVNDLGLDWSREELTARALAVGGVAVSFRKAVMAPWKPFLRFTGTGQSWGLFAYPDPYAGRLIIRSRDAKGDWTEHFRAPAEGDDWLVARMLFRRVRGVYDDAGDRARPGKAHDRFVNWVAREIFLREPEAQSVEVRFDVTEVLTPDEGPWEPETLRHNRTRTRDRLMGAP